MKLSQHDLILEGSAPHEWILQARKWIPAVAGVDHLQEDYLVDSDLVELKTLKARIESQVLHFEVNGSNFEPGETSRLGDLAEWMIKLHALSSQLHYRLRITVYGHSDSSGLEGKNLTLSRARADHVVSALVAAGVPNTILMAQGLGATRPLLKETTETAKQRNRRVSFRVTLRGVAE